MHEGAIAVGLANHGGIAAIVAPARHHDGVGGFGRCAARAGERESDGQRRDGRMKFHVGSVIVGIGTASQCPLLRAVWRATD